MPLYEWISSVCSSGQSFEQGTYEQETYVQGVDSVSSKTMRHIWRDKSPHSQRNRRVDSGRSPGRDIGRSPGRDSGRSPGRDSGRSPGRDSGRSPGRDSGRSPGRDGRNSGPGRRSRRSDASRSSSVSSRKSYSHRRRENRLNQLYPVKRGDDDEDYDYAYDNDHDNDTRLLEDVTQDHNWNQAAGFYPHHSSQFQRSDRSFSSGNQTCLIPDQFSPRSSPNKSNKDDIPSVVVVERDHHHGSNGQYQSAHYDHQMKPHQRNLDRNKQFRVKPNHSNMSRQKYNDTDETLIKMPMGTTKPLKKAEKLERKRSILPALRRTLTFNKSTLARNRRLKKQSQIKAGKNMRLKMQRDKRDDRPTSIPRNSVRSEDKAGHHIYHPEYEEGRQENTYYSRSADHHAQIMSPLSNDSRFSYDRRV